MKTSKSFLVSVLLITGIFVLAGCESGSQNTSAATAEMKTFAECLTEKGVKMYGTAVCPYCTKQKAMFGEAFSSVDYVDCQENPVACTQAGIEGIPTWIYSSGTKLQGLQELTTLAQEAGCPAPTVE